MVATSPLQHSKSGKRVLTGRCIIADHDIRYTAHARALQSFIEKVTVFKSATGYVDVDLAHPTVSSEVAQSGARIYKLATLYDKYDEYADLLSTQGLVTLAVKYAALTPADYHSVRDEVSTRERLQVALGKTIKGEDHTSTPS